jgi:glycerol-3-phosphate acyltransferase PlsY
MISALLVLLAAYLLGAIPFGLLVGYLYRMDIRRYGSGNIGATNAFRTLGLLPGALVFGLDLLKGALPVLLAEKMTANPWIIILAGGLAIVGHSFSIFLKFKGGRGAATGLGVILGIAPDIFIFAVILAAIIIAATRYVSAGSMLTAVAVSLALTLLGRPLPYVLVAWVVTILIIYRHQPNIKRLLAGTEPKLGERK